MKTINQLLYVDYWITLAKHWVYPLNFEVVWCITFIKLEKSQTRVLVCWPLKQPPWTRRGLTSCSRAHLESNCSSSWMETLLRSAFPFQSRTARIQKLAWPPCVELIWIARDRFIHLRRLVHRNLLDISTQTTTPTITPPRYQKSICSRTTRRPPPPDLRHVSRLVPSPHPSMAAYNCSTGGRL